MKKYFITNYNITILVTLSKYKPANHTCVIYYCILKFFNDNYLASIITHWHSKADAQWIRTNVLVTQKWWLISCSNWLKIDFYFPLWIRFGLCTKVKSPLKRICPRTILVALRWCACVFTFFLLVLVLAHLLFQPIYIIDSLFSSAKFLDLAPPHFIR